MCVQELFTSNIYCLGNNGLFVTSVFCSINNRFVSYRPVLARRYLT